MTLDITLKEFNLEEFIAELNKINIYPCIVENKDDVELQITNEKRIVIQTEIAFWDKWEVVRSFHFAQWRLAIMMAPQFVMED